MTVASISEDQKFVAVRWYAPAGETYKEDTFKSEMLTLATNNTVTRVSVGGV